MRNIYGTVSPPIIVLVRPQLGENIGMCARAMWNCGVKQLRLVQPRDSWPNRSALASAAGATIIINSVQIFETVEEAISDLNFVLASSARPRGMKKCVSTPLQAASAIHSAAANGLKTGVLFGKESSGLNNDDIALANKIITVPLNPQFNSLNLAQSVFVICYEWHKLYVENFATNTNLKKQMSDPATKYELIKLFEHLEEELDSCGFFQANEKRPTMVRNIRNIFARSQLSAQEVRTLRGIISSLVKFGGEKGSKKK